MRWGQGRGVRHRFDTDGVRSHKGQATAEFAISLPVIVLLLLGIVDFGRAIATHSAIVTASREAARYGAATGDAVGVSPALPQYVDCAGIRAAARRVVGGLVTLPDGAIVITYDNGSGTPTGSPCTTSGGPHPSAILRLDRVVVEVTSTYELISPARLFVPTVTVVSIDRRSIMKVP